MPNIDELSIEIQANADKATQSIKNLTASLNGLSTALNRINANNITRFAKSMESLSTIGRRTDETGRAVTKFADSIAKSFNIKSKQGIDAIRDAMLELTDAHRKFQQSGGNDFALGENLEDAKRSAAKTIEAFAKTKIQVDSTTQSLLDYIKTTNKGAGKVDVSEMAKEFGENFNSMQKVLGSAFVSNVDKAKGSALDFAAYLNELNGELDRSFDTHTVTKGFEELVEALRKGREEIQQDVVSYEEARNVVAEYSVGIDRIVQAEAELKSSNGIDQLAESLTKLSGITLPDFTPFADAINALNRASTDRVVKNIQAVKQALNETTQATTVMSQEVGTALSTMGSFSFDNLGSSTSFVLGVSEQITASFQRMTTALATVGDKITTIATPVQLFSGFVDEATAKVWAFTQALHEMYSRMIATTAFTFSEPIIDENVVDVDAVEIITDSMRLLEGATDSVIEKTNEYTDALEEAANAAGQIDPHFKDIQDSWEKINNSSDDGNKSAESLEKMKSSAVTLGAALLATGKMVDSLGRKMGQLGNYGMKGLKVLYTPLKNITNEYREKLSKITGFFKNFRGRIQKQLEKLSQFWKRTMKTFTFMLVRKAITAIIDNVKEAIDELALFEKHLGTLSQGKFNNSLSEIIADFRYIGRAVVAAFEPLINFVVPAINAVANALANVLALVGEFFAAFTGQNYFVKAKKTVVDYGDSIDSNNKKLKEQEKLLLGIDELNVLPKKPDDSSGGGGGGVNFADAFEEKPVSDKMKGIAQKIKDILGQLFAPLKAAWDEVGPYVMEQFGYLWSQIKRLTSDIGNDFLTMWNEPETQRIIESILRTVGHLAGGLGNLVSNFADSWEKYGLGIFEKLRDRFGNLQTWVEKTALAFKDWTTGVTFDNLLSSIDLLLSKMEGLCNFIGGVFYDVMTNVVMKYVEFLVEQGLPHLITTIGEVLDAFDFEKIRGDLQIVEKAFETMAEQIDIGVTNAIGNVGKALAEWMNSDEFTKFMEALAHFMDLITAERVEKLFTALGTGLLNTAKGIASFVSSEGFQNFVDKIIEWYDSKSAEEIAGYLEKIAWAIGLFKFGEFVAPGVAGFLTFIGKIIEFKQLSTIAGYFSKLAGGTSALGTAASGASGGVSGFATALGSIAAPVAIVVGVLATLVASFGGIKGTIEELKRRFEEVKKVFDDLKEKVIKAKDEGFIPLEGAIKVIKDAFANFLESLGSFRGAWVLVLDVLQKVVELLVKQFMGALQVIMGVLPGVLTAIGGLINFISGVINIVGGVFSTVAGLVQGFIGIIQLVVGTITGNEKIVTDALENIQKSFDALSQGVGSILEGISQAFTGAFEFVIGLVGGFVNGVIEFFKQLKYNLIGDPIVIDLVEGVVKWFGELFTGATKWVEELVKGVLKFFGDLLTGAVEKAGEIKDQVVGKFEEFKEGAVQKFTDFKDGAIQKVKDVASTVAQKAGEIKKDAVGKFEEFKNNSVKKFESFKTNASKAVGAAKTEIVRKAGDIKKDFLEKIKQIPKDGKEKFNDLKTAANEKFTAVKDKIRDKMNDTVEVVRNKLETIKTRFEKVNLESVGTNVVRGFLSGLKSKWVDVVSWASDAVSKLKEKFSDALQINSPSKVFEEYGKYTVEGFNQGLEKFKDTTNKTVNDWIGDFSDVQVNLTPTLSANSLPASSLVNSDFGGNSTVGGQVTNNNNTNNETKVILQLDGKTIYETVIKQNNQQIMRTGRSLLAY